MAGKSVFKLNGLFYNSLSSYLKESRRGLNKMHRKTAIEFNERRKEYLRKCTEEEKKEFLKPRRSNFIDWNYGAEIFAFGKRLNENFTPELLTQAFTFKSYITKEEEKIREAGVEVQKRNLKTNNNLAVLGENIISNYVTRYSAFVFPRFPLEGIRAIHDYLTSERVLARIAKNLGTTMLILSAEYPPNDEMYSTTFKAIVGALHECQGVSRANLFIRDLVLTQLARKELCSFLTIENPVQVLNDILVRDGKEIGEPRIICKSASNTLEANYHIGIYSNKQLVGHGSGETVNTAINMAAFDALNRLFHSTESRAPIPYDLEEVPENITNLSINEWHSGAFEKSQRKIKG